LAIGSSVLMACICGGVMTTLMPPRPAPPTVHQPATHTVHPPTTAPTLVYELIGTITYANQPKRQIGLKHDGIPGLLTAGDHTFVVAPDAATPVDQSWPGSPVGQQVMFVLETRRNQWIMKRAFCRGSAPAAAEG
jgi:hypothetical protein